MPTVSAFIDGMRAVFGRNEVDGWIRTGLRDGTFHATENGFTVGVKPRT